MKGAARRAARYLPGRSALALAGLAAVSGASILPRQMEFGPGLNWDAVAYICIARNLLAGEGYAGCGGTGAMEYWPPLYPALLAAASLPGFDPRNAAGPLNAALLGALVFTAGQWLRRNLASRPLAAAGCLAVAVSVPLAWISSYAMSELAFLLFSALALIHADRSLENGRTASLMWAAAFAALAWATRYVGVTVVGVVALALLLERRFAPRRKALRIWLYTAISAAPVCAWMARNLIETGRFFARPQPVDYSPEGILIGIAEGVGGWMAHEPAHWGGSALGPHGAFGAAALLLAAAAVGYGGARALPRIARSRERPFLLFGGFAFAYLGFVAYGMLAGFTLHGLQPRYLLPAYLPFLFMAFLAADRLTGAEGKGRWRRPLAFAAAAGLCLWLLQGAHARLTMVQETLTSAFSGPRWTDSEVVRYVLDNPGGVVWTNADRVFRLVVGEATAIRLLPSDLAGWGKWQAQPGDRIAWFHGFPQWRQPYDAADVYALPMTSLSTAAGDGLVFRIDRPADVEDKAPFADAVLEKENATPVASSVFDVHVGAKGKRLIYIGRTCSEGDSEARFILHVWPVHAADLPNSRRKHGFENLDFNFESYGSKAKNSCMTFASLPEYDIARISTGQIDSAGRIWRVEFPLPEAARKARSGR